MIVKARLHKYMRRFHLLDADNFTPEECSKDTFNQSIIKKELRQVSRLSMTTLLTTEGFDQNKSILFSNETLVHEWVNNSIN